MAIAIPGSMGGCRWESLFFSFEDGKVRVQANKEKLSWNPRRLHEIQGLKQTVRGSRNVGTDDHWHEDVGSAGLLNFSLTLGMPV
jgi:hypothetical protein